MTKSQEHSFDIEQIITEMMKCSKHAVLEDGTIEYGFDIGRARKYLNELLSTDNAQG